jgi:membrane-bound serine protease (ClpP class)
MFRVLRQVVQARRAVAILCFAAIGAGAALLGAAGAKALAQSSQPVVVDLRVDGIISPASAGFITQGLSQAAGDKAALVVIQLNTPGGLDTSMRTIVQAILASPVPVATFVSPGGARAASAGTFILYASHIAAMTPASNLGAASPVQIGGLSPASGGHDTMSTKIANDAVAYIRSLAQLRGRNIQFAESAVRDAASLTANDALKRNVIDVVAGNLDELLAKVDGREIKLAQGSVVLHTRDARIVHEAPGWRSQLLALIANPQVALVLLMAGIYGLFYEFINPGLALPGVAGLICLLLGLYAFQLLPVNWVGVGLLGLGISLMVAEAFLPSFGIAGAGGVAAFILGGLFLTDTGVPGYDLSLPFLAAVALCSAAFLIIVGTVAARAHKRPVVSGREDMLGKEGVVSAVGHDAVYADIRGESWRVRHEGPLAPGDHVRVTGIEGLTLLVERARTDRKQG